MLKIVGYTDRPSVRPGERLDFKVSCEAGATAYQARMVRLICGDDGRDSPGYKAQPVGAAVDGTYPGRRQGIDIGSYLVATAPMAIQAAGGLTLAALVAPHWIDKGSPQTILACVDGDRGMTLALDRSGAASVTLSNGRGQIALGTGRPLAARQWYLVAASFDPAQRRIVVIQRAINPQFGEPELVDGSATIPFALPDLAAAQVSAAASVIRDAEPAHRSQHHFDGKIESPAIYTGWIDPSRILHPGWATNPCILRWDFSRDMAKRRVLDQSGNGHDGLLVNLPTRAVTGAAWRGQTTQWRDRPELYAAIHFHCDDLYDMGWATDFSWELPMDLASGIYACELTTPDGGEDILPFFVLPPRGTATAPLAFLASTYTYLAYANS
ncbi:MAG: hypothetical protein JNL25_14210, partial [Rhodospirillaceae bacterium]|nr:hypothetical protein [Rhodospirillaceae bacterium]